MGEFCNGMKVVHSISIEELVSVWKGLDLQDINNIIAQFFACIIPFE